MGHLILGIALLLWGICATAGSRINDPKGVLDQPNQLQLLLNTGAINKTLGTALQGQIFSFSKDQSADISRQFDETLKELNATSKVCSSLAIDSFTLSVVPGALTISQIPSQQALKLSVEITSITASGHIEADGCKFLSIKDNFTFTLEKPRLTLAFSLGIKDDKLGIALIGAPDFSFQNVNLDLQHVWDGLESIAGGLATLLGNLAVGIVKSDIAKTVNETLSKAALPVNITDDLPELAAIKQSPVEIDFDATLKGIVPKNSGLVADADIRLFVDPGDSDCKIDKTLPPLHKKPGPPTLKNYEAPSAVGLAIPDGIVNDLLYVFWQRGQFCITDTKIDPLLSLYWSQLLREMEHIAKIDLILYSPPVVHFGKGGSREITIDINDFDLKVDAGKVLEVNELYELEIRTLRLKGSLSAGVTPRINPATNMIELVMGTPYISHVDLYRNGKLLQGEDRLNEGELNDFIGKVMPKLLKGMESLPVAPSVFDVQRYKIVLDQLIAEQGYLNAFLSVYTPNDFDVDLVPPETSLVDFKDNYSLKCVSSDGYTNADGFEDGMGECTSAVQISVGARDDRSGPLQYQWKLNDGDWSLPTTQTEIMIPDLVVGASYALSVRAVDRFQNSDPTPATMDFGIAPQQSTSCGLLRSKPVGASSAKALVALCAFGLFFGFRRRISK